MRGAGTSGPGAFHHVLRSPQSTFCVREPRNLDRAPSRCASREPGVEPGRDRAVRRTAVGVPASASPQGAVLARMGPAAAAGQTRDSAGQPGSLGVSPP